MEIHEVKLGDVAAVKGGKRLPKGINLITKPNTHPYIRVRDLSGKRTLELDSSFEFVDDETQKSISRYTVNDGDIVLSIVGTIGLVAIVGKSLNEANLTENCVKLTSLSGVDRDFLYYFLKSPYGQQEITRGTVGAVQAKLPIKNIQDITIPLPDELTQSKIAAVLSSLDTKIETNQKINDNLLQQAVAIYREWFLDGPEVAKWPTVTLDSVTSLVSRGITPKYADNSEQIVINQKCIRDHYIDVTLARTHNPKAITEKWLQYGDLLINSTGEGTLGRTAQVWFMPENITVDSHVTIVRSQSQLLLFYIGLWGISHEREIEALHTGSTGQTELPRDRVKAMELRLPDNETLEKLNAIIQPMVSTIETNQTVPPDNPLYDRICCRKSMVSVFRNNREIFYGEVRKVPNIDRYRNKQIAASTTGYEGPYTVGVTVDGQILGSWIAANSIDTNQLSIGLNNWIKGTDDGIASKVEKDGIISAINQSSEEVAILAGRINLNGSVTANNYFKIKTDGSMEAIAGQIGGFNINSDYIAFGDWTHASNWLSMCTPHGGAGDVYLGKGGISTDSFDGQSGSIVRSIKMTEGTIGFYKGAYECGFVGVSDGNEMLNKLIFGHKFILRPYLKALQSTSGDEGLQRIQHLEQMAGNIEIKTAELIQFDFSGAAKF